MATVCEKFFTHFQQGRLERRRERAILMQFVAAPHERSAKLAKRLHETEHAGDDTT